MSEIIFSHFPDDIKDSFVDVAAHMWIQGAEWAIDQARQGVKVGDIEANMPSITDAQAQIMEQLGDM